MNQTTGTNSPDAEALNQSASSRYLQYKQSLSSYKQALTFSDRNEWGEATNEELQQVADLEAMFPIKLNEVPEGANITKLILQIRKITDRLQTNYRQIQLRIQID